MREVIFEVKFQHKETKETYGQMLTLEYLLERNGCLYNPNIWEIVYKRQYTGLKDKFGIRIFEGDLLKCNGKLLDEPKEIIGRIGKIFWSGKGYTIGLQNQNGAWECPNTMSYVSDKLEVVGKDIK